MILLRRFFILVLGLVLALGLRAGLHIGLHLGIGVISCSESFSFSCKVNS
jgi:hypothetical protein